MKISFSISIFKMATIKDYAAVLCVVAFSNVLDFFFLRRLNYERQVAEV